MQRRRVAALAVCALLLALATGQDSKAAEGVPGDHSIVVFAAASLTNALQELGDAFGKSSGIAVTFSFAASSALARQIENGAPADVFLSADVEWMDYLQARKLLRPGSRHDLLGNRLVLIAPTDSTIRLKIEPHFALSAALGKERLATGDPDSVPVGRYARAALTQLGVWSSVEGRIVRADNVRAALAFVEHGEVPLGIVYETDALIDPGVRIVDVFPEGTHPPITYPLALTRDAKGAASRFADYLHTPAATAVFVKYGFVPLN